MSELTSMVTGLVRFSYLNVFTPKAAPGSDKEKYSVSILIKKDDKETIRKVKACIAAAVEEGKKNKFGKKTVGLKLPVRDGDKEREDEAYKGCWFINCSATRMPGLVDKNRKPITSATAVKSGDYGRVDINFYPFNTNGNVGVACGLNNLQLIRPGEALGLVNDPEKAFNDEFQDDDFNDDFDSEDEIPF